MKISELEVGCTSDLRHIEMIDAPQFHHTVLLRDLFTPAHVAFLRDLAADWDREAQITELYGKGALEPTVWRMNADACRQRAAIARSIEHRVAFLISLSPPGTMNDKTEAPTAPIMPADPRKSFDLEHIFKYHAPSGEQLAQYSRLREAARVFAIAIVQDTPTGADQSAAIRHVREAVMTANAAVALGGRLNHQG